jgi:hypothetical protein
MKPYSIDDWWDVLTFRYEELGRPVPKRFSWLYDITRWVFKRGAR